MNGGYSGVLETSCGSSAIAVGDTLYELSGVEFTERDRTVIDMSSADCEEVTIAEPADCYRCVLCNLYVVCIYAIV